MLKGFARDGQIEPEMVADPMLPSVGWAWLIESLDEQGASYAAPSGTITRVASECFGAMAEEPPTAEIEVRASWTALNEDLGPHVEGWAHLLCQTAGLPPLPDGVSALAPRGVTRRGRATAP